MKINSYSFKQPSFKADIYEGTISNIFECELRPKLREAKTDKEKESILSLAEKVYKKANEIKRWDNNWVKIGNIYSPEDKSCGLGIMRDSLFMSKNIMIIPPEQVKKDGWTNSFLNLTKQQYLDARRPYILERAKTAARNIDGEILSKAPQKLGKDSYKIFLEEYLRLKNATKSNFEETLKKKLEITG